MPRYLVQDKEVADDDPAWPALLETIYASRVRPRCLCVPGGVEMYTARIDQHVIVKRMPDTGSQHAVECEAYEPPAELSGLGQVMGSAIRPNIEDGMTDLRFGFSLSHRAGQARVAGVGAEKGSVKADGCRLSLRGTLHYLWEEAGFHKWTPAMAGKRHWSVLRKYLLLAARDKRAKGVALVDRLYIPEAFALEEKEEQIGRRNAQWAKIMMGSRDGSRQLMLLIGEVNELAPARFGYRLVIKHVPDVHFIVPEDLAKRLQRRFAMELGLWDAVDDAHLVVTATFGMPANGAPTIEEATVMVVNKQWLPIDNTFEHQLLALLIDGRRRFAKSLRYNAAQDVPLANVVLADTTPPAALYVLLPTATDIYEQAIEALIQERVEMGAWRWRTKEGAMPALPPPTLP